MREAQARAGIEPAIEVLQTSALPLGDLAESMFLAAGVRRHWEGNLKAVVGNCQL